MNHNSNDESTSVLNSNTNENQSKQEDNLTKEQTLNSINSNQAKIEDEKKEESTTILNRDIKDGVLYLTTDDLVDVYLHSSVGADEKVYVPKNYIQKFHLDNDEIKFVNVNGINVPVSQFVSLDSAYDDDLLKKQIENSNSIISNTKKSETSDDNEINIIKQLQSENKDTNKSLISKSNPTSVKNEPVLLVSPIFDPISKGIETKKPVQLIKPIETNYNVQKVVPVIHEVELPSEDEIGIIQQLQSENKDTNQSLLEKEVSNNSYKENKAVLISPIFDPISQGISIKTPIKLITPSTSTNDIKQVVPVIHEVELPSQDEINTIQELQTQNKNTSNSLKNSNFKNLNNNDLSQKLDKNIDVLPSKDEITIIQKLQSENQDTNKSLISKANPASVKDEPTLLVSPILEPISNGIDTKKSVQIITPIDSNSEIKKVIPVIHEVQLPSEDEIGIIQQLQSENKNTNQSLLEKEVSNNSYKENQTVLISPILQEPLNEGAFTKKLEPKSHDIEELSQDEVNIIKELQTQNKDTNESLMNKIAPKNQNQNQKILSSPILDPIEASVDNTNTKPKDIEVKSNNNLPSQDEINTIQQLQAQNKNTNDSLLVKNENQSRINKSQVQEQNQNIPEAYLKSDDEVTKIAKNDPIQKIDDSLLYLQQKYAGQKDYQIERQNEINKNNVNNLNNNQTINNDSLNPKPQFVEVTTPAQNYADNKTICSSPIPQTNDEQYTKDLYQAIKQEQVNQIYNSINSDSAKVITISEPELVQEFNKYKVDPRRKIYIIEEEDALKTFGIVDDNSVDQKVLFEGNVLKVYSGENNQLLSAPYGTIEDNYLNDNVFFLENNFTVAVERYIPRTKINMNNFRVEVSYVAFRLPKDKKLIAARNADIKDYETRIHDYFKDIGESINDPQKEGNKTYISLATSHELGLVDNQTKANNDLEKIKVTKNGVNEKINLIDIFNTFYSEYLKPNRKYDRRIKHFIRMIRQILMDSCYYAESGLLVLNYAEVLLFLDQYYDLNLEYVYDLNTQASNILLLDTVKYAIKNNLTSIDGYLKVNDNSYFIPLNYDYVLYDSKLLNIVDDSALDIIEVERVLLNRPLFTDDEFFNMDPSNFDRLRAISPYIDFVKYYEQKTIQSMYSNSFFSRISEDDIKHQINEANNKQKLDEIIKEQKEVVKPYFEQDEEEYKQDSLNNKKDESTKNKVENGVLYLSEKELVNLYQDSHISEDGTLYVDKNEAEKYGLVNEDIKAINVNNQTIPLSNITQSEEINEIKNKYINNQTTKNNEEPNKTKIEDGIIYLSEKDLVHLYQHSHVTEDGTVYLDKIEADKYGLNNANIKGISVNGQIIPLSSITKQEMDKELADEQEFIKAKKHSKKRSK